MVIMKKMFKKAIATLLAVTTLSAGAVNAFAADNNDSVCVTSIPHTHVCSSTRQQIVNSTPAGSHQHPIEYDTNGNVIKFAICYLRVDTYQISSICGICGQVCSSYTSNVTVHSV